MRLNDPTLLRQQCYSNGKWISASDKAVITVTNPATGETIGTAPSLGRAEIAEAVASAGAALDAWRSLTALERGKYLHAWSELIEEHLDDLAMILTSEQGKPLAEAKGEIAQGNTYLPWYAEEARRAYGDTIPAPRRGVRPLTIRQGIGVAAAITPWNFPFSMIPRKAAPALAAGCPVIIKPASQTPFSALALVELAHRAGFPPGVVNAITGSAGIIGEELATNPVVRKLSFTGSTEVGKLLMAQCAATMKKLSMELGGNAPFIVFRDADLDNAVNCAVKSKFRNAGQTCICADRFLVHADIYDEFARRFAEKAAAIKLGNGVDPGVEQGPLVNRAALENMIRLMADATAKGAKILTGGNPAALGGLFFEPTVLTGVKPDMLAWREEVFGPIAAVMSFKEENEAVKLANDTSFGLASYLFTKDAGTIVRVGEALEFGMVAVNDFVLAAAEVPFGGIKDSGLGREGGHEGISDYLETKLIMLGGLEA